jgi:5-methylcytosine-specific restriction endonuclease McrA
MARAIISRADAIRQNLKFYFTGKPCRYGHVAMRLTSCSQCRKCNLLRCRLRWKIHRTTMLSTMRLYYAARRKHIIARVAAYTARNAGAVKRYQDRYRKKNRTRQKKLARRHYRENRAAYMSRAAIWRTAHPQVSLAITRRRRRRLRIAAGSYTCADVDRIFQRQQGKCVGCQCRLKRFEVDHKKPLSRGGSNFPRNLQLLCKPCNRSKHAKTMAEWRRDQRIANEACRVATSIKASRSGARRRESAYS